MNRISNPTHAVQPRDRLTGRHAVLLPERSEVVCEPCRSVHTSSDILVLAFPISSMISPQIRRDRISDSTEIPRTTDETPLIVTDG